MSHGLFVCLFLPEGSGKCTDSNLQTGEMQSKNGFTTLPRPALRRWELFDTSQCLTEAVRFIYLFYLGCICQVRQRQACYSSQRCLFFQQKNKPEPRAPEVIGRGWKNLLMFSLKKECHLVVLGQTSCSKLEGRENGQKWKRILLCFVLLGKKPACLPPR